MNNLINKNNLKVNKITYKSNSIIIDTPLGLFILKEDNIKTYDYLLSRGFNYLLPIIDYDNSNILFKYEKSIDYDNNEKAFDFIRLLSLLHNKTSYYINIKKEDNKKIFDKINNYLDNIKNYYDNLSSVIENKEYYSPNEYLFIRNISVIYKNIFIVKDKLNNWYKKYKDNSRKRVCTLINNYDLNNLIKTKDNIYLFDFKNSYIDSPIYELNNFYNKYCLDLDFKDLYKSYSKVIELNNYEKELLLIMNMIPTKIIIKNDIKNIIDIKNKISKFYVNLNLEKEEERSAHKNENNK
ncbi:MAG: hypothetical protein IKE73_01220 [Bacilli bacterium]|nr:hypothetical protein [Bacilli bacterium]